ncbi:TPA: polysaccharide biosynthesis C-terminal domain-containing protein, partial [Streptococcus suis]|nr:polysaccharide biosynthesis C-terminal domain-containing protein [Streptococcus suis]
NDRTDYVNYAAVTIIASVGSYFLNFIRLREFISIQPWKTLNIKKHLKPTLTFFMMTVATTIYTSLDSVMLGFMLDDKTVGLYNAAMNIKNVLVSLVTSLGVVLLPRLSVYIKQNKTEEFKALTEKALTFVIFSSIPLTLFFIIFAEQAIYFLSGESFSGAIIPLQISMPTLIFIGMSNLFGIQMLVPMNKEYIVVKSVIAGAVINLILNCLLIPRYGANGAAIGTLVAEFIVTLYQGYYLKNLLLKQIPYLQLPKFIVAAVVGVFFVFLVAENVQIRSYFLQLLLFSLIYAVLYVCLLGLLKEKNIIYLVGWLKKQRF